MLRKTLSWLKNKIKAALPKLVKTSKIALSLVVITCLAIEAPQIHKNWLRDTVGSKVVMMVKVDPRGRTMGGGTGFMVNAPSGNSYLLTNAHICEAFPEGEVTVQLPSGTLLPRRILQVSDTTDLCLVEGLPGQSGLSLADSVAPGELINIVGHPSLQPLTVSQGELIGDEEVMMFAGIIGLDIQEKDCNKPKNKIRQFETFFGPLTVCVTVVMAKKTTAVALPGNSGSPTVNKWGNLVGVLFAGPGGDGANWGLIIPLKDIVKLLASY